MLAEIARKTPADVKVLVSVPFGPQIARITFAPSKAISAPSPVQCLSSTGFVGKFLILQIGFVQAGKMKCSVCLALALTLMAMFVVTYARPEEALDSLMMSSDLEPVSDPVPRLLAEALGSGAAAGSYGASEPSIPINVTSEPAKAPSSSHTAAAGVVSLIAAAAAAFAML